MSSYCEYVVTHPQDSYNRLYHDTQYGFPLRHDNALFGRLLLEINQAGLSWLTVLRKAENFQRAYEDYDIDTIAAYEQKDIDRLMADAGIIRNRLKVNAAVTNARRIQALRIKHGTFKAWLDRHHSLSLEEWTKLFRSTFVFTGGEIVREFLVSTAYLPGAHEESCPIYRRIAVLKPAWAIIK